MRDYKLRKKVRNDYVTKDSASKDFLSTSKVTAKTSEMTSPVGIDTNGALWSVLGGGGSSIPVSTITESHCSMTYDEIEAYLDDNTPVVCRYDYYYFGDLQGIYYGLWHFDNGSMQCLFFSSSYEGTGTLWVRQFELSISNTVTYREYQITG